MKLVNAPYFNRRNWLFEQMENLDLTSEELLVVLCIDYMNEFKQFIDIASLSKKLKMDGSDVDDLLNNLIAKGYVRMEMGNRCMLFNIDRVFLQKEDDQPCHENEFKNLFVLYENEFKRPLSQRESETLSEWIALYDLKLIEYALREAIIYNSVNFNYINKILINWKENNFSAKSYEERDN